ncbi:polysaccharide deacetylase family protein [Terrabacter sp. MAHUQ-38]|uniref:polysaccharide deacetylase family protein n=1 Tax=unclassified Terrabacter TaxID=2630222 RepID=UPI00165D9385|nr:polysaccharide deacetylase family protein [Terrabacter sp. MAHUQ-38]
MAQGDVFEAVSRRSVVLGAASLCVLVAWPRVDEALHPGGPGRETDSPALRHDVDPQGVTRVRTSRRWVALTFDDGPDPRFTPDVLDVLRTYGCRATFFAVGSNVEAHPDLARRIVAEGHRLSNHTHDHVWLDRVDTDTVADQLIRGRDAVAAFDPTGGRLVRPPRGWTSRSVARSTSELGMRSVYWSTCLESALHDGPAVAGGAVGAVLGPGDVLLAHDGGRVVGPNPQDLDRSRTVEALPVLLERLRRRGLVGVPVQDLVASGTPH